MVIPIFKNELDGKKLLEMRLLNPTRSIVNFLLNFAFREKFFEKWRFLQKKRPWSATLALNEAKKGYVLHLFPFFELKCVWHTTVGSDKKFKRRLTFISLLYPSRFIYCLFVFQHFGFFHVSARLLDIFYFLRFLLNRLQISLQP